MTPTRVLQLGGDAGEVRAVRLALGPGHRPAHPAGTAVQPLVALVQVQAGLSKRE